MKNRFQKVLLVLLTVFSYTSGYSQGFIWNAGFNGFFDNREYFNNYIEPQSMFGSRIFGFAGFAIDEKQEFGAGVDFLYEFGGEVSSNSFAPIVYYHYKNSLVNLYFGAFPRKYLADFPLVLETDTIQYYRPNIEGIFVKFSKPWGSHSFWIDWTSRQTDTDRESFKIYGTGKLQKGLFFYRHDLMLVHLAGPAIAIPDDHIRDQGGAYFRGGLNLSSQTFLDSLSISTGYAMSYDQLRGVYGLTFYNGSLTELVFEKWNVGIKNTLYLGDGQAPGVGEAVYEAPFYNRTDLYWKVFRSYAVDARIEFSFHLIEDVLDLSQKFTIYARLEGNKNSKRKVKTQDR